MQKRWFGTTQAVAKLLITVFLIIFISDLFFKGNLYSYGALQKDTGEYWRFVTAAFLHGNILHLAANCLAIWYVAEILETKLSPVWFIVIFLMANIVTYIAFSKVWTFDTSVGSSPGICMLFIS